MPAEVISLDQQRAAREARNVRRLRRMIGNCQRGIKEECGLTNPEECAVHGPLVRPDAS
jgi:hypothetical protein